MRSSFPFSADGRSASANSTVAALAPGPLDFFQNRLRHGLIPASEDDIECNDARAEFGRLPDDGGCVLILQFECRQLLQVLPCDIDMNNAGIAGGARPCSYRQRRTWSNHRISKDSSGLPASRIQTAATPQMTRRSGHGDLNQTCSPAGFAGTELPAITKLGVLAVLRWRESTRRGGLPRN